MPSPSMLLLTFVFVFLACASRTSAFLSRMKPSKCSIQMSSASDDTAKSFRDRAVDKISTGFKYSTSAAAVAGIVAGVSNVPTSGAAEDLEQVTDKAFFDVQINGAPAGKIVIGLFGKTVPKTVENFKSISKGFLKKDGKTLTYAGSPFHRIIPNFMLQGGDITRGDGRGGESIYGGKFNDENFLIPHREAGYMSMANSGPGTNGSQFFITTVACPWLNGKHVVFGKVTEGMDLVKKIESLGSQSGAPSARVTISSSGLM